MYSYVHSQKSLSQRLAHRDAVYRWFSSHGYVLPAAQLGVKVEHSSSTKTGIPSTLPHFNMHYSTSQIMRKLETLLLTKWSLSEQTALQAGNWHLSYSWEETFII